MSTIQEITQAANATATSSSTTNTTDILGKEDFLTLLVAQLQNQDPLNPDEPTEFTAQLAQFSQLEQLFNLNDSLENLANSNANADKFSTLQTIGKYVVYQDSNFEYDGEGEVQLGYQLDGNASEVQISIKKDGSVVKVLDGTELSEGNHFMTWDGLDENGVPLSEGSYSIVISAKAEEGGSVAASPLMKSLVTGVDLTGDYGGTLQTEAGEVDFSSIIGVYDTAESIAEDSEETTDEESSATASLAESTATTTASLLASSSDEDE